MDLLGGVHVGGCAGTNPCSLRSGGVLQTADISSPDRGPVQGCHFERGEWRRSLAINI